MFPASTNSSEGKCVATPNVCKTPTPGGPVPIPYPSIAMPVQADSKTLAESVLICGFPAATTLTQIPMSSGDEAGTLGGVVSNKNMGSCKYTLGSFMVRMEGQEAVYHGAMIAHNNHSNPNMPAGSQVAPSQSTVTVAP
jgi:uncharacterized Zn-binding protein involved in type VI secretion